MTSRLFKQRSVVTKKISMKSSKKENSGTKLPNPKKTETTLILSQESRPSTRSSSDSILSTTNLILRNLHQLFSCLQSSEAKKESKLTQMCSFPIFERFEWKQIKASS